MGNSNQVRVDALKVKIGDLEERYKALKDDTNKASAQLISSNDDVERNRIGRKLSKMHKDLSDLEEALYSANEELAKKESQFIDAAGLSENLRYDSALKLQEILSQYSSQMTPDLVSEAYNFCKPKIGWNHPNPPQKLSRLIWVVRDMPLDDRFFSPFIKLIAFASARLSTSQEVNSQLHALAKSEDEKFLSYFDLVPPLKPHDSENTEEIQSYLLVVVQRSEVDRSKYYISGYQIPDFKDYKPQQRLGYSKLRNDIRDSEALTIKNVQDILPVLIQGYLEQCTDWEAEPTIEVFLPLPLLNEPINIWSCQEYNIPMFIDCKYRLVVRSSERLKRYKHKGLWKKKWEMVKKKKERGCSACQLFEESGLRLDSSLMPQWRRPETVALKISQAPELTEESSVLAAVLVAAIPIALWLRQDLGDNPLVLSHQETQLEELLEGCIGAIPDVVFDKRGERQMKKKSESEHIGHHLSLLWEDADLLPPTTI